jgi:hypothetical protein
MESIKLEQMMAFVHTLVIQLVSGFLHCAISFYHYVCNNIRKLKFPGKQTGQQIED